MLLTRSPLSPQGLPPRDPVRLACLRRAASVSSEPGSNSPSYYTSLPHLRREASLLYAYDDPERNHYRGFVLAEPLSRFCRALTTAEWSKTVLLGISGPRGAKMHCTTILTPLLGEREPLNRFAPSRELHDPLPLPCQGPRFCDASRRPAHAAPHVKDPLLPPHAPRPRRFRPGRTGPEARGNLLHPPSYVKYFR